MRRSLLMTVAILTLSVGGLPHSSFAQNEDSKELESGWRTQVNPGIFLLGKTNKYMSVGKTNCFSVGLSGKLLFFGTERGIVVWEIATSKIEKVLETEQGVRSLNISPDGSKIFATIQGVGSDNYPTGPTSVHVRDLRTYETVQEFELSDRGYIFDVQISADGKNIASSHDPLVVWEVESGTQLFSQTAKHGFADGVVFSDDGTKLFALDYEMKTLGCWNATTGALTSILGKPFNNDPRVIQAMPDGRHVLIGGMKGLRVFDIIDKKPIEISPELKRLRKATNFGISSDGEALVIFRRAIKKSNEQRILLVSPKTWEIEREIETPGWLLNQIEFSADSKRVFTLSPFDSKGVVETSLVRPHQARNEFTGNPSVVRFSPDDKRIVAGSELGELIHFDIATGKTMGHHALAGVTRLNYSRRGSHLLIGSMGNQLAILDTTKQKFVRYSKMNDEYEPTMTEHFRSLMGTRFEDRSSETSTWLSSISFSEDGKDVMAFGTNQFQARLIRSSIASGKMVNRKNFQLDRLFPDLEPSSTTSAVSPDGSLLAIEMTSPKIKLIDTASGNLKGEIETPADGWVIRMSFSPDGKQLMVYEYVDKDERRLFFFDVESGELLHESRNYNWGTYSGDGKRIVATKGRTIAILDSRNWEELFKTEVDKDFWKMHSQVAISENGKQLAFGRSDGRIEVWELERLE